MRLCPLLIVGALLQASAAVPTKGDRCRCLPGDGCWPSQAKWATLNQNTGGRLVATVPIGSVCHDPTYDEKACAQLKSEYTQPEVHYSSSSSMMERYWGNQSCNPFATRDQTCANLGNFVSYAVNVSDTSHIVTAINFAKKENVRLVVRNTGHDFLGRSTGRGALAVWTHHLKSMEMLPDYKSEGYTGPALKMGAGVQGSEAMAFLADHGFVAVGGWCPSVGIAGGFTAGGGHSPLGSKFGMAADQTLEFEVVTAAGAVVKASPSTNTDLYWALSGGGPGNYGVVMSVTIRVHSDAPTTGFFATIPRTNTTDNVAFWAAMRAFFDLLPTLADHGIGVTFSIMPDVFYVIPLTAHGMTLSETQALVKPFTNALARVSGQQSQWLESTGYNKHWTTFVRPGPIGSHWQSSARIVPRGITTKRDALDKLMARLKFFVDGKGISIGGTAVGAKKRTNVDNAVLPAWRDGVALLGLLLPWSDVPADWNKMLDNQRFLSQEMRPLFEEVTPNSGTYMNEADYAQPNWRDAFFGRNYDDLVAAKRHWDPESLFWALETPGSEAWTVAADGRMCRASR